MALKGNAKSGAKEWGGKARKKEGKALRAAAKRALKKSHR